MDSPVKNKKTKLSKKNPDIRKKIQKMVDPYTRKSERFFPTTKAPMEAFFGVPILAD